MSFETHFLNQAESGQWAKLKLIFQWYSNNNQWESIKPAKDEAIDFLDAIAAEIESDNGYYLYTFMPSLKQQRSLAINHIKTWISIKPKLFFPTADINVYRIAVQLAIRVFWPDTLNQGEFGFCGPTTVLFDFDKRYPLRYAKCGIQLVETGTGRIELNDGGLGFDISLDRTEAGDWKTKGLPEVDFIILRAIRQKAKALVPGSQSGGMDFKFDSDPSHATTPKQIALLLDKAGYSDVKDDTIGWPGKAGQGTPSSFANKANLDRCIIYSRATITKPVIIMLVAVELADRALDPVAIDTSGRWDKANKLHELHWIVVEKLKYSGRNVTGRMVTWTESKDFTFDKPTFLKLYHGFVYARS
ncbi:MAG: hypothetical protein M3H12_08125 [Chromatiales bacterium]|nr:hypothetical protein [Gammaproteobacteria bacterium]